MYIISRATMQRVTLPPRLHDVIAAAMMIELFVLGSNTNRASVASIRLHEHGGLEPQQHEHGGLEPQQPRSTYCPNQFIYIFTYLIKIVYLCTY